MVGGASRGCRPSSMILSMIAATVASSSLLVIEQSLHARHRPPPGQRHAEVPARLDSAATALRRAPFAHQLEWRRAMDTQVGPEGAVAALKLVHTVEHLRTVQEMSKVGGGFDTDTYCAPGSWEAMLDGTRAWLEAVAVAAAGRGPALALCRPAGHHATRNVAMGFGLVNFAATAVAAELESSPSSQVAILDWDVHHGNGVADIFRDEARVLYCSIHEAGGFPGTGMDETDRGPHGNLLHLPLPRGSGSQAYLSALRERALPFLLGDGEQGAPSTLLICSGYDALEADPLATMMLSPATYGESIHSITHEFGFPCERIALGLEGGYSLSQEDGMPAALVQTVAALLSPSES